MNESQPRVERAPCACMHVAGKRMQCAELFPICTLPIDPIEGGEAGLRAGWRHLSFLSMDPFDQGEDIEGGEAALRKLRKAGEGVVSALSCAPRVSITMNSQLLTMTHYPIASDGNESTNAVACLSACSRELAARSESLESVLLNFSKDERRVASLNYHREINSSNSQIDLTAERRSQSISPPNKLSQEMS